MSDSDSARAREYRHLSTVLDRDDPAVSDDERLDLARRLVRLAPAQAGSWWKLATQIDWMLRDVEGHELAQHPLFSELQAAWDRAIELDSSDAAAPYNKSTSLRRAGLLREAFTALMLAGATEAAHPSSDIEWPASWHFEDAASVALELSDHVSAIHAARAALGAGAADSSPECLLERLREESGSPGPA